MFQHVMRPVVQFIITTGIKLWEGHLNLGKTCFTLVWSLWYYFAISILISFFQLLTCSSVKFLQIFWNSWKIQWFKCFIIVILYLFRHHSIPVFVHVLEEFLNNALLIIIYFKIIFVFVFFIRTVYQHYSYLFSYCIYIWVILP